MMVTENMGLFNIKEVPITNKEVSINYTASPSVVNYTYYIYKDGKIFNQATTNNKISNIVLEESGTYKVVVKNFDSLGREYEISSGEYKIDLEAPYIISKNVLSMTQTKNFDYSLLENQMQVADKQDGDLFNKMTCNIEGVNFDEIGSKELTCTVSDEAGNETSKTFILSIKKDTTMQISIALLGICISLIILLLIFFKYRRAMIYKEKIVKYSVEPLKDREISIFEKMANKYYKFCHRLSKSLKKSEVLSNLAKKYKKYLPLYHKYCHDEMDFIAIKITLAFILILISFVSKTIQFKIMTLGDLVIPYIFGYFLPNILFMTNYKIYRNKLENDFLQSIIIMNNAFKSGRSITQAIDLVTHELKGPIGEEFKKMALELSFGLSIEVVFKRFSERIKLEEVAYLTASLSILNQTGGNIIKVFSSIEKSLFNKKRLKLEMNSLTGSSKIIVYILFIVPIIFVLLISVISPSYFEPFYTTTFGYILMFIMLIIYLTYIWFVKKIMKVRM